MAMKILVVFLWFMTMVSPIGINDVSDDSAASHV